MDEFPTTSENDHVVLNQIGGRSRKVTMPKSPSYDAKLCIVTLRLRHTISLSTTWRAVSVIVVSPRRKYVSGYSNYCLVMHQRSGYDAHSKGTNRGYISVRHAHAQVADCVRNNYC